MICYDGYDLDHWDLLTINNSIRCYTGSMHPSTNYGQFTIVGRRTLYRDNYTDGKLYRNYEFYVIQFEDGHYSSCTSSQIYSGKVRNWYTPIVVGVGYTGQGPYIGCKGTQHTKEYSLWKAMLFRCYDVNAQILNPCYKNVTVDPRWHNFQNFCEDIQELEGYAEWKAGEDYHLDKDIKWVEGAKKVYSYKTCIFIPASLNLTLPTENSRRYIATRIKDSYEEEFIKQIHFANKYGLDGPSICKCVSGKQKNHKGWTFKVKENKSEYNKKNI